MKPPNYERKRLLALKFTKKQLNLAEQILRKKKGKQLQRSPARMRIHAH